MELRTTVASLLASVILLSACENDSTTTTERSESSNAAKSSGSSFGSAASTSGGDLMSAMNSSMSKMHSMEMTGDFDKDWANMMIEHHQGAIDMSQVELSKGTDEQLKAKAQEIIDKQKKEQQELGTIAKNYKSSGMNHGEGELEKSMKGMMEKMKSMKMTGDVDRDFATMMIQHHEDGIEMSEMQLEHGMSEELKAIAKKDIEAQQKDIKELRSLLSNKKG